MPTTLVDLQTVGFCNSQASGILSFKLQYVLVVLSREDCTRIGTS